MVETRTSVAYGVLTRLGFTPHQSDGFSVYRHGESDTVIAFPKWGRPTVPAAEMEVIRQQVVWRGVATEEAFDRAMAAAEATVAASAAGKRPARRHKVAKAG